MGYFSQLALANDFYGNRPDTSFPTPIIVLKWRIMDLENQLLELKDNRSAFEGPAIPKEVIHYVLPEHLTQIEEIELAIDLAKQRLGKEEYEKKKEYTEEFPEERLLSPRVVIIPAAVTVEKNGIGEKVRANGA